MDFIKVLLDTVIYRSQKFVCENLRIPGRWKQTLCIPISYSSFQGLSSTSTGFLRNCYFVYEERTALQLYYVLALILYYLFFVAISHSMCASGQPDTLMFVHPTHLIL